MMRQHAHAIDGYYGDEHLDDMPVRANVFLDGDVYQFFGDAVARRVGKISIHGCARWMYILPECMSGNSTTGRIPNDRGISHHKASNPFLCLLLDCLHETGYLRLNEAWDNFEVLKQVLMKHQTSTSYRRDDFTAARIILFTHFNTSKSSHASLNFG